jgi:hypothetical protein
LLAIGESGTGKTGALASLAKAGYRLWILDFDNGLDILATSLRDDPSALARVTYATLRDRRVFKNGKPTLVPPIMAYLEAGKVLNEWQDTVGEFGPSDILVIDTLTMFSEAAFHYSLQLQGRLNQRAHQTDYGDLATGVLAFIDTITAADAGYNVIVNTHIKYFGGDDETQMQARGLPNAKGQQISKDVSTFFNSVVLYHTQGAGQATKRVISTTPRGVIGVKTSAPGKVKPTYSIETGLAELFFDILGSRPSPTVQRPVHEHSETSKETTT